MDRKGGAFIWYELLTTDVAAAKAFYDAVVGWNIDPAGDETPGGFRYHMINRSDGKPSGGMIALTADRKAGGAQPGWLGYIHAPDVDAAVEFVTGQGGALHMAPMDMPGVGRMAMVGDPWGAVFYVMAPQPPADDPDPVGEAFSVDQPQHIRWNELQSTDPAEAVAFYTQLFGWTQEGAMPMGEMGEYQFLQHNGTMIGALMPKMPDVPQSLWSYYIGVDNIDRAAAAVTAGGGTQLGEIQEIPGGEYSLHIMDPQGAAIGLVGPRLQDNAQGDD